MRKGVKSSAGHIRAGIEPHAPIYYLQTEHQKSEQVDPNKWAVDMDTWLQATHLEHFSNTEQDTTPPPALSTHGVTTHATEIT